MHSKWKLTSTGAGSRRLDLLLDLGWEPLNVSNNTVWLRGPQINCGHPYSIKSADKAGGISTLCTTCGDVLAQEPDYIITEDGAVRSPRQEPYHPAQTGATISALTPDSKPSGLAAAIPAAPAGDGAASSVAPPASKWWSWRRPKHSS